MGEMNRKDFLILLSSLAANRTYFDHFVSVFCFGYIF